MRILFRSSVSVFVCILYSGFFFFFSILGRLYSGGICLSACFSTVIVVIVIIVIRIIVLILLFYQSFLFFLSFRSLLISIL